LTELNIFIPIRIHFNLLLTTDNRGKELLLFYFRIHYKICLICILGNYIKSEHMFSKKKKKEREEGWKGRKEGEREEKKGGLPWKKATTQERLLSGPFLHPGLSAVCVRRMKHVTCLFGRAEWTKPPPVLPSLESLSGEEERTNKRRAGSDDHGPAPATASFVNRWLWEHCYIHVVPGCFCATTAD
jgi:hypothetical protein